MFANSLQPSVLSLFSSTASSPLLLATHGSTSASPTDALVKLLSDATDTDHLSSDPFSTVPPNLRGKGVDIARGNLRSQVLHLQAPDILTTWVRWGSFRSSLGIQLPLLVLQVKDLGLPFFLEVGVRDERGARAILRISTFQEKPRAYQTTPPLLHLPLSFPGPSASQLTPWSTLTLPLPTLLSSFSHLENGTLFARFASISFVKVHANCRLRRIWCAAEGEGGEVDERMAVRGMRTELAMFAG